MSPPATSLTALLIIDMQKFFLPMTSSSLPNILTLISTFKSLSLPLIFTQHGHSSAELTAPFTNQLVQKWGSSGSIATGSSDWKLIPSIAKESTGHPIVGKNTYDAFVNTDLATLLKEKQVERVVICGVMTDCCCDTTARSAFNRGFETWLVDDACGTASDEQHKAGLKGFGFAFGEVVKTEEVLKRLK